jgi:hypothetical protein
MILADGREKRANITTVSSATPTMFSSASIVIRMFAATPMGMMFP